MNIRKRIEDLESRIIPQPSKFCGCFDAHIKAAIAWAYDGIEYDESAFTLPDSDYCHKCRKPVNPANLQYIENMNKIYGKFPEMYEQFIYEHKK